MLQQVLSLKYLGFSLEEIRDHIIPLDSTEQVHSVLENQKAEVKERIESLKGVLAAIDALQENILRSDPVDFSRYSGIVAAIHEKWEHFWMIGKMDDTLAGHALKALQVYLEANNIHVAFPATNNKEEI